MSNSDETTLKPTPIQEWRRKRQEGQEVILPTELIVRARRFSLLDLFEKGISKDVEALLLEIISRPDPEVILANFKKFLPVIDLVITNAIIDPPLANESDEIHLALSELTSMDKMSLFNWCNSIK